MAGYQRIAGYYLKTIDLHQTLDPSAKTFTKIMEELLYLEIPNPKLAEVQDWLQNQWSAPGNKIATDSGVKLTIAGGELVVFLWSLQRTTYLKVFRWAAQKLPGEQQILRQLTTEIRSAFPHHYPQLPAIDLSNQSIFEAIAPFYPKTAEYFQKMPKGAADLQRVYWWEKRWRESVRNPQQPKQVVFASSHPETPDYDLIYIGGALGVIHAAVMAKIGYRVLLLERLPFGRMHREWNISRDEFQRLIDLGLFTVAEFESLIAREYVDGFSKFFDANNPVKLQSKVLSTPTVLNICIDAEKLLRVCGEKLRAAGGEIWDETEFQRVDVTGKAATVSATYLPDGSQRVASGRLVIDAMGTASPIAWQLNGAGTFNSVCPTVGAVISKGFAPEVWDAQYGDVLFSHGDISRGRQLIWELFPGAGDEITVYLFHYHQVNAENPGSLLEMYEDFFTILPEYRRCDMEQMEWRKPTFGYIPGHFTTGRKNRTIAFDRVLAIGDAASLQSPLVFTGFGSMVRNMPRLTHLLDTALNHDLLTAKDLNLVCAYQSNVAVTWMFSKGMMVPTGQHLPPQRVNVMLNNFFGLLANEPPAVADTFIKDRTDWLTFNRLALKAAWQNPALLLWIWQMAGTKDLLRWLVSYFNFTIAALVNFCFASWVPKLAWQWQSSIESNNPQLWLWLLSWIYTLRGGNKNPQTRWQIPLPIKTVVKSEIEQVLS
jgi:lycopene cyclase CruA